MDWLRVYLFGCRCICFLHYEQNPLTALENGVMTSLKTFAMHFSVVEGAASTSNIIPYVQLTDQTLPERAT